ncbi:beta-ketoacyl-CoA thiolase [Phaeodactylum tricornutum CCAP 1055/1]|jgi:acetyl-CoA acyltransferase|uniref:acetyl-CoA C-acyltransferase n=1 Tax=Phaeodactylum tricornutum (strain CCAP 1055/1) TaxID=556484 RepID=B5Y3B5_PHATC|nr:beta-ketoacyl-CoA thiolase [Phaeodactylum tricornutum CCAP 1055/1]ACI65089.1 beta-ketoacyl-CoA thiolase [Phaeodactylum tricornutum CCAP 1055/1]|eukprot:XP_002185619.1 beta-ketoacyl-CoA thiolase [Phaeodactylum tricornutum CCAP 1055/1]
MLSTSVRAISRGSPLVQTAARRSLASLALTPNDPVVVVSGVRLPFAMTSTIYEDQLAVDLQRLAIQGLLTQTALPKSEVDYVIAGNVIQEVRTSNIAREASINAGLPLHVGAHTIAQACISANAAICAGAEKILTGHASVVIAGGCETFSDVPIRLTRPIRQKLITMNKAMKKGGMVGGISHLLKGLSLKDVSVETPAIANYTTGEVMGVSSDRLAAKFGVSRHDQDAFTVRSHTMAAKAHTDGFYKNEVVPYKGSTQENGIKGDSTIESVAKLKPAFVKPHGTHTAANSSFLTDGAAATLIMSESKAKELGYKPLAYLRDWSFKACDPFEELLLGPTYCSQEILARNKLQMSDMGVLEIHEAFAGQILANLTAMESQTFADKNFGGKIVGKVDVDKMNTKGGSLALGHPFGATGSRLVSTASRRLQHEGARFALLAACADGGMGHACLLERYDNDN